MYTFKPYTIMQDIYFGCIWKHYTCLYCCKHCTMFKAKNLFVYSPLFSQLSPCLYKRINFLFILHYFSHLLSLVTGSIIIKHIVYSLKLVLIDHLLNSCIKITYFKPFYCVSFKWCIQYEFMNAVRVCKLFHAVSAACKKQNSYYNITSSLHALK